jgi:hypothetical protein
LNGEKITFKTIQNALLRSWNRHFANSSKKWKMMKRSICSCEAYNNKPPNMLRFIMNACWN